MTACSSSTFAGTMKPGQGTLAASRDRSRVRDVKVNDYNDDDDRRNHRQQPQHHTANDIGDRYNAGHQPSNWSEHPGHQIPGNAAVAECPYPGTGDDLHAMSSQVFGGGDGVGSRTTTNNATAGNGILKKKATTTTSPHPAASFAAASHQNQHQHQHQHYRNGGQEGGRPRSQTSTVAAPRYRQREEEDDAGDSFTELTSSSRSAGGKGTSSRHQASNRTTVKSARSTVTTNRSSVTSARSPANTISYTSPETGQSTSSKSEHRSSTSATSQRSSSRSRANNAITADTTSETTPTTTGTASTSRHHHHSAASKVSPAPTSSSLTALSTGVGAAPVSWTSQPASSPATLIHLQRVMPRIDNDDVTLNDDVTPPSFIRSTDSDDLSREEFSSMTG